MSQLSVQPSHFIHSSRSGSSIWKNYGLSIVLLILFVVTAIGQSVAGWYDYNDDRVDHALGQVTFAHYLGTGHFWEALGENWESEFLQMAAFVMLTACLYQKGSPESNDPDAREPQRPLTPSSPRAAKQQGSIRWLYEHSLSLTLLALFVLSFVIHAIGGRAVFNEEQQAHGHAAVSVIKYIMSSRFWFESLQNWQSEFLSIAAMVILSVFLRHKGSAESKDPATPHWQNE